MTLHNRRNIYAKRQLVRQDREPLSISSLPDAVHLSRGRLEVSLETVEQLAEAMYALARALDSGLDNFIGAYEVRPPEDNSPELDEISQMFDDLDKVDYSYRVPSR